MSTATRRIKELEKQLSEANRVIVGLLEYAERTESTACAFAMEVGASDKLISAGLKKHVLAKFEADRVAAGASGRMFGG